jgi:cephalosporin hydroxylase
MGTDQALQEKTRDWFNHASRHEYSYHFEWMGRPIIQFPQDMVAMQEIIWRVKPDIIVETGIAHGGSLIFYASIMQMMRIHGKVLGIDIDIRPHNKKALDEHMMRDRIEMIQGSSIEEGIFSKVKDIVDTYEKPLVILDSNHTHDHVRQELELYADFVRKDSYLLVFDTVVEFMDKELSSKRPWGHGNNPYTAVQDFLKGNNRFEVDQEIENKLQISVAPGGYLKCLSD